MNAPLSPPEPAFPAAVTTSEPILSPGLQGDSNTSMPAAHKEASLREDSAIVAGRRHSREKVTITTEEIARLRADLLAERTALAVQRANAEYERRVAGCIRQSLESLLEHTTQPCFVLDRDGNVTHWNEALARYCGIPAESAFGKPLNSLIAPELQEQIDDLLQPSIESYTEVELCAVQTIPGPFAFTASTSANHLTLLPLHHIPGCTESIIGLVEPI